MGLRGETSFWWPQDRPPAERPWLVEIGWGEVEGKAACTRLTVRARDDAQPVTRKLLVALVPEIEERRLAHEQQYKRAAESQADEVGRRADRIRSEQIVTAERTGGRFMRDDAFERLVHTARVYVEALAGGRAPVQAVADSLDLSRSAAGALVRRARRLGLLDPATGPMARGVTTTTEKE